MRHCVRAPLNYDGICAAPGYTNFADYAAEPLPDFGTEPGHCTKRGIQIIENEGIFIHANMMIERDEPLNFIVDDTARDNTTATHLINGLDAWERSSFNIHGEVWSPEAYFQKCRDIMPEASILADKLQENLGNSTRPRSSLFKQLQSVLGSSKAPALKNLNTTVQAGTGSKADSSYRPTVCGQENVGHEFSSVFMLEWGSDIEVAWSSPYFNNPDSIYEFFPLTIFMQRVRLEPTLLSIRYSNLISNLIDALKGNVTTFFVGHDTDFHATSLWMDMEWEGPGQYESFSTPPGSLMEFDVTDERITIHFWATTFDTADGKLESTPVNFPNGENSISLDSFTLLAESLMKSECTSNIGKIPF